MTPLADFELVARMQGGDRAAFATLVNRHKHKLVNYLTGLMRDRDRSEELAQDVFLKLYQHRGRYQERGQFLPYLYRIATNLARSEEFTDRVMERLDEPAPRATHVPRAWVFAGACGVLIGVWLGAVSFDARRERRETAERLEMMRDEYRSLEVELEELRSLASEAQPVLELGGTEQVDFVFDLRRLAQERGKARSQPTSHSPR